MLETAQKIVDGFKAHHLAVFQELTNLVGLPMVKFLDAGGTTMDLSDPRDGQVIPVEKSRAAIIAADEPGTLRSPYGAPTNG